MGDPRAHTYLRDYFNNCVILSEWIDHNMTYVDVDGLMLRASRVQ